MLRLSINIQAHVGRSGCSVWENFRQPKTLCASKNLARQKILNGTTVYSHMTKDNYYGELVLEKYNLAITQLQEDFKSQHLKNLVCLAIWVRDKTNP